MEDSTASERTSLFPSMIRNVEKHSWDMRSIILVLVLLSAPGSSYYLSQQSHYAAAVTTLVNITDFDGDGYGDLAIGVPDEDVGSIANAGAVNVIYGSSAGLAAARNQFWTQQSPSVNSVPIANEFFGTSVAAGDFNADGYDDLAVGVPEELISGVKVGAVNVIYGSSSGLQATGTGGPDDQLWTQNSPGVDDDAENDDFGFSVASGDFNADGYDDLAIGAREEWINSPTTIQSAGAVNVIYGSPIGLSATDPAGAGGHADQFWTQNSPNIEEDAELSDAFGTSVAAGDFNADGYDDLAVSVPREFENALDGAGAVNVIYGSPIGLSATDPAGAGGHADQIWHQDKTEIEGNAASGDFFGHALATGDFNNDGFTDLAIGVPGESVGTVGRPGAVSVIYGSPIGLSATDPAGAGGHADQIWHQDKSGIEDTAENGEQFGFSVAAGDFNKDGFADLAIGVTLESFEVPSGGFVRPGAVNVIYGSPIGLSATDPAGAGGHADQIWHQDKTGVLDQNEIGDNYGYSLATGDFNNDGYGDLAIGIPLEDVAAIQDAGAVNLIYGSSSGLQATGTGGPDDQLWTQDSILDQSEKLDKFSGYVP